MAFENPFGDPFAPPKRRTAAPLLTPEEEASLLEQLGHSTLGGLSAVGTVLDTPGAFIRTALAGENPFAGIFDPSQRVGGRELLEGWGVLDPNTEGFDGGDVAGFAADVLLDPTTYLTLGLGAANAAGKAATKAGMLPKAIRGAGDALQTGVRQQMAEQGLGGVARLSVPFTDIGIDLSTPALGRAMDFTGEALRYGDIPFTNFSPGRAAAAMFSKGVKNTYTKPAQIAAQAMSEAERLAGEESLGLSIDAYRGLDGLGLEPDAQFDLLSKAVEGVPLSAVDEALLLGPMPSRSEDGIPIYRRTNTGEKLSASEKPHGLYFSVGDKTTSPHIDVGELDIAGIARPKNLLEASPITAAHARFGGGSGSVSAGVSALAQLIAPEDFQRLLRASKADLQAEMAARFPGDYSRYYDAYELLEAYGANLAREQGFDAIRLIDPEFARSQNSALPRTEDFSELVALSDDILDLPQVRRRTGFENVVQQMIGQKDTAFQELLDTGRFIGELEPENMGHFPRYLSNAAAQGGAKRIFPNTIDSALHRVDAIRDIPRHILNELSQRTATVDDVVARLGLDEEAAEGLARWYSTIEPKPPGPLYGDPLRDYSRYLKQVTQAKEAAKGTLEFLGKHASTAAAGVPLAEVLAKAKMADPTGEVTTQAAQNILQKLGQQVPPGTDPTALLANYTVPADIAADVSRMIDGFSAPEGLRPALDAFDWFTQTFKLGVTTPWPSFHTRNMVTGLWQNLVGGALDVGSYSDAYKLLRGDAIESALNHPLVKKAGITDPEQASDFLRDAVYQYNVAGQSFTNEIVGKFVPPSENFAGNILGEPGAELSLSGIGEAAVAGAREGASQGGGRIRQLLKGAAGGVVGYGRHAGDLVESLNRAAGFLSLTKQGFDPSVAAAKIRALHVDFGNLSDFERGFMRRVIPFYSWSKGMIPEVLTEIAQRPGGLTGQVAQLAGNIREGEDAFLPEYLQGGLGLPLGGEEDGTQRFLTNLDLPVESVFEPLHTGPNAISKSGLDVLGMMNPLLKAPLEMATGKQFFTGRDLRDLHSTTPLPMLDELIMNSPFARVLSTGNQVGQLIEGRKDPLTFGLNTLTGARVSDVDLDRHRSIAARELIEDSLRGGEGVSFFEHMTVKPDELAQMSPDEQELFSLYRQLSNRAQKEARERKKNQPLQIGIAR